MGRITKSFRMIFYEILTSLRNGYRQALKDRSRREAFDHLVPAWSNELGAMSYAEIPSALDAMLLTSIVDNQKCILELSQRCKNLELKLAELDAHAHR